MAVVAGTVALAKNFNILLGAPLGIVEPVGSIEMGFSTNGGNHTTKRLNWVAQLYLDAAKLLNPSEIAVLCVN